MKYILIFLFLFQGKLIAQKDLFEIQIHTLDGELITMKKFEGKKILMVVISPDNMNNHRLTFLDSLQVANPSVIVIVIPALDFGGNKNEEILEGIKNNMPVHFIITSPGEVKKNKGERQIRLLKWLTTDTENLHFNAEVITDDQLYFVSQSGILHAVLEKGASANLINKLLKEEDVTQ